MPSVFLHFGKTWLAFFQSAKCTDQWSLGTRLAECVGVPFVTVNRCKPRQSIPDDRFYIYFEDHVFGFCKLLSYTRAY